MASNAVEHVRQGEIGQAGALLDCGMVLDAVEVVLIAHPEMGDMRKAQVVVDACYDVPGNGLQLCECRRILDLFRNMAAATIPAVRPAGQMGLDARVGVASGALLVHRKLRENAILVKLMAKRAIGPEPGLRVDTTLRIDMLRVGEAEENWTRSPIQREWQKSVRAQRREIGMALPAEDRRRFRPIVLLVAQYALIVPWTSELNRALLRGNMTHDAFNPKLLGMEVVHEELPRFWHAPEVGFCALPRRRCIQQASQSDAGRHPHQ